MKILMCYTFLMLLLPISVCPSSDGISINEAIGVACRVAKYKNYSFDNKKIEVIEIDSDHKRGPIRLYVLWSMLQDKEKVKKIFKYNSFIVHFFISEALDGGVLDGGLTVIVNSKNGDVLYVYDM